MPEYQLDEEIEKIISEAVTKLLQNGVEVSGTALFNMLCNFFEEENGEHRKKLIVSAMIEVKRALRQDDSPLDDRTFLPKNKLH